jgi:flagellar hook-length control protein FliK
MMSLLTDLLQAGTSNLKKSISGMPDGEHGDSDFAQTFGHVMGASKEGSGKEIVGKEGATTEGAGVEGAGVTESMSPTAGTAGSSTVLASKTDTEITSMTQPTSTIDVVTQADTSIAPNHGKQVQTARSLEEGTATSAFNLAALEEHSLQTTTMTQSRGSTASASALANVAASTDIDPSAMAASERGFSANSSSTAVSASALANVAASIDIDPSAMAALERGFSANSSSAAVSASTLANATASTDADASAMAALERGFHANTSSAASAVAMNGASQSAPEAVTTLMSSSPQVADASLKATAASLVNRDAMTMALMEAGQSSSANVKGGASASGTNSQVNPLSGASLAAGKLLAEGTLPLETAELETLDNDGLELLEDGLRRSAPDNRAIDRRAAAPFSPTVTLSEPSLSRAPSTLTVADGSLGERPQLTNDLAANVRLLSNQGGGEAKLHLNPAELGRMSISVATEGNETKVVFVVETAQARQSIESALPRLKEMLEQSGLSLTDSDVSERRSQQSQTQSEGSSGDGSAEAQHQAAHSPGDDSADVAVADAVTLSLSLDPDRILDTFA